jgi:oligoribonuclease (3'-5' exoribonuclease)
LAAFIQRCFLGAKPELAGNSVHFKLSFMKEHMPRTAGLLSYSLYDVSGALRMLNRFAGKNIQHPPGVVAHRAMPDVLASIEILRNVVKEVM